MIHWIRNLAIVGSSIIIILLFSYATGYELGGQLNYAGTALESQYSWLILPAVLFLILTFFDLIMGDEDETT